MTLIEAVEAEAQEHMARLRRQAFVRLSIFFGVLLVLMLAVVLGGFVDLSPSDLRNTIREVGPLAPLAFVFVSGMLTALFVPGPVFAIAAGLLFGAVGGILLGIVGSALSALICFEIAVRMGRRSAEEIAGARLGQITAWLNRYGLAAVIGLRLMPAMPDAVMNYAAGLTRLRRWQVALGTAIGVIPRTVGWGLVGAAAGGATSGWYAAAGTVLIVAADVGGALGVVIAAKYFGVSPRAMWRRMRGVPEEHVTHKLAPMRIAIDGPAGAGKSTVARLVADRLGFTYLDTGAMYRCAALASLRGVERPGAVDIDFGADGAVLLDGEDVSQAIRSPEVTALASKVAEAAEVRADLVTRQQQLMQSGDWVAEGRDVGTVVMPGAELKVFLDADPLERAQRRAEQLGADVEIILAQQNERDERDRTREVSPLRAADDAVNLDTTGLSIEEVVGRIVELAGERAAG